MKDTVSIVIVNWNGKKHLEYCLPSVFSIKYPSFEVIVVDNGSTDGSIDFIKKNFPKVIIIQNKENMGFATGNNIGVKHANGKYILFLNNDTKVRPDLLSVLVDKFKKSREIGIVQPKILLLDKKDTLESIGSFLTYTGFLYHYCLEEKDSVEADKEIEIFSAKGSCFLIKKDIFDKVGGFDNDFFYYFEETDLCWRIWLAGYRIKYIPSAVIYHKGWGTSRNIRLYNISFNSFKNRINSLIKNLSFKKLLLIIPIHLIVCISVSVAYFFVLKFDNSFAIFNSIIWNAINFPKTLKKRKLIQSKVRKVKDDDIFPIIVKNIGVSYYFKIFSNSILRTSRLVKGFIKK